MADIGEEDAFGEGQDFGLPPAQGSGQDAIMQALDNPSSIHPTYDSASADAPLNELDTRFGVEGVDFGGMQEVKDEMAEVSDAVNAVTDESWQPNTATFEGTALEQAPQEEEPGIVGLS